MCRTTQRSWRCFVARGFHSTFLMAPGPGDLVANTVGDNLLRSSVCGQPRWMMPHHCSQATGFAGSSAQSLKSVAVKVASSASMSIQVLPLPKTMSFSFSSTHAFRSCIMRLSMSSMALLCLMCKMRWMVALGTRFKSKNKRAAWVWRDVWLEPLASTKRGRRWCGLM